jgi:YVTN family beta-propeller protein
MTVYFLRTLLLIAALSAALDAQPLAYVTNLTGRSVSVVDPTIGQQIATIQVGEDPFDVAVTPDGSRAYVSLLPTEQIKIIDTATNQVVKTIPFHQESPSKVVFSPDGTRAYIAMLQGNVYTYDTTTLQRVGTVQSNDPNPFGMALTPDAGLLYVTVSFIDVVKVIDTATSTLQTTVFLPPGTDPRGITISGNRAYVAGARSNTVIVLSIPDNAVVATVPVGFSPNSIGVAATRGRAYVTNFGGDTISAIDTATNSVANTIAAFSPNQVVVSPDQASAYYTSTDGNALSLLDLNTETVTTNITVGDRPWAVSLGKNPGHTFARIFVGLANSDEVGIRFDLRAEAYVNGSLLATGEANSVAGGSSGFNNARLDEISLSPDAPFAVAPGDTVSVKLLARNACVGSGKNSGRARLWFNDSAANSRFRAVLGSTGTNFFLQNGSVLGATAGSGPRAFVDINAGAKCGPFQSFGRWSRVVN